MASYAFEKPRSMVAQIHKAMSDAISRGALKPGQALKESDLQSWFNTSRAPIREAIRLLEADGMVIVDHYKRKYVRPITKEILGETIPVLACLEGLAANLAAQRITQEQIRGLHKNNEEMKKSFEEKRYDLCANLNFDFHRTYVKMANNTPLIRAIRSIMKNTIWLSIANLYFQKSELILFSLVEHKEIIHAFEDHNSAKAEEEVRKHVISSMGHALESPVFDSDSKIPVPSGGRYLEEKIKTKT